MAKIVSVTSRNATGDGQVSYWRLEGGKATAFVQWPAPGLTVEAANAGDLLRKIRADEVGWPNWQQGKVSYEIQYFGTDIGEWVPRVHRPVVANHHQNLGADFPRHLADRDAIIGLSRQIRIIAARLERIFDTVHPSPGNEATFGDEIRHVLMLSATEAEAQMKAILRENGLPFDSMGQYTALEQHMNLSGYVANLTLTHLGERHPFAGFPLAAPAWWNAYNNTKHDREQHLNQATLSAAVDAYCSLLILYRAQFGPPGTYTDDPIAASVMVGVHLRDPQPASGAEVFFAPLGEAPWKVTRLGDK